MRACVCVCVCVCVCSSLCVDVRQASHCIEMVPAAMNQYAAINITCERVKPAQNNVIRAQALRASVGRGRRSRRPPRTPTPEVATWRAVCGRGRKQHEEVRLRAALRARLVTRWVLVASLLPFYLLIGNRETGAGLSC